ncbi:glyoxalase/bleomycin resistance/dioxygenase family protein [Nocardiopsis sp. TNDT3]|uniref:glyoxalase/bleomycin resistance/dioxygenase family protein n=1 Tax=Nocardiopsis sp. TNDT3 TaxID=2249354 RepID=UPI001E5D0BCD|nr:glyoxalase/bleomycin resistance/dioxygenase family protein [Nocardiopsis sp. TNDT3]
MEEGPQEDGLPEAALPRGTLLVLHTGRVEECRAFYAGLGLRFVRERHGSGPEHHAAELDGGAVVEIYPATAERSTGAARLGFTVRGDRAVPPLEPGRRVLTDPDGRKVDLRVV